MSDNPRTARPTAKQRAILAGLPLAVGLLVPSMTLVGVQVFVGSVPLGRAVEDVLRRQFQPGRNLFMLSLLGLIPFAVLAVMLQVYAANGTLRACLATMVGGLVGILALMIPAHVSVWCPLYGPGRMSSTAVIAFLFIPFYCIVTMFIGLLIGRLCTRQSWFRAYPIGHCAGCGYDQRGNVSGACPECGYSSYLRKNESAER